MWLPPINHIIYIPITLAIGFFVGWRVGATSIQSRWDRAEKRRRFEEEGA